jgi:cyclopropane fatty-acyl-phospholipid synthase-like methyltransferase
MTGSHATHHGGTDATHAAYAGSPPWEIGRPQPAFVALARAGVVRGRVLDIGCGTGEHVLLCAGLGLDATGIDLADTALQVARRAADDRGLPARFLRHDARHLDELGESFDTVLDSLVFHAVPAPDRRAYLDAVRSVLVPGGRLLMLCYSDRQPGDGLPHRLGRHEILAALSDGWRVDAVDAATADTAVDPPQVRAWLTTATRR